MSYTIKVTESASIILEKHTNEIDLEWLQKQVGGYIELVYLDTYRQGVCAVVDEEGLCKGKNFNPLATLFCHAHGVECMLVGDVVFCDTEYSYDGSDSCGFSYDMAMSICNELKQHRQKAFGRDL